MYTRPGLAEIAATPAVMLLQGIFETAVSRLESVASRLEAAEVRTSHAVDPTCASRFRLAWLSTARLHIQKAKSALISARPWDMTHLFPSAAGPTERAARRQPAAADARTLRRSRSLRSCSVAAAGPRRGGLQHHGPASVSQRQRLSGGVRCGRHVKGSEVCCGRCAARRRRCEAQRHHARRFHR